MDKAAADVDWIISIGIFMIYMTFFFLYLTPFTQEQPDAVDALLFDVKEQLVDNATWHVQRTPLFVHSNLTGTEPVIADFLQDWANISFSDNTSFYRRDNKLITRVRLSPGTNLKWLVSSDESYPQPVVQLDFEATDSTVAMSRFSAEFDGLLQEATHFEQKRITGYNLSLDSSPVSVETAVKESNFTDIAARHRASAETLNHTTYIVAGFPRLYNYAEPKQRFEPHELTVRMSLHNYTHYFIDNSLSGSLNFSTGSCKSKTARYIDFYDSISGVSLITEENANISFCTGNTSVTLAVRMNLSNETSYNVLFHEGDYNATLKYVNPYKTATGLVENLTGISMSLLTRLNETDYDTLKDAWKYPSSREFSFVLLNESGEPILNYTPTSPGVVNVFSKNFEESVLDKYGNRKKHKVRLRGW